MINITEKDCTKSFISGFYTKCFFEVERFFMGILQKWTRQQQFVFLEKKMSVELERMQNKLNKS